MAASAPAGPPTAFLDRCTELGLLAFQYSDPDTFVAASRQPAELSTLLRSRPMVELVRARLNRASADGTRVLEDILFPGMSIGVISHRSGPVQAGFTVLIFLWQDVFRNEAFLEICHGAGLDPDHLAADVAPFLRAPATDTHLAMRSLLGTAQDLEQIEDQKMALDASS
jgi:hypothetical protein